MSPTEFMQAYEATTNAHDIDALLDLIAEDAVYLVEGRTIKHRADQREG